MILFLIEKNENYTSNRGVTRKEKKEVGTDKVGD
jgi:hypothetical protein